MTLRAFRCPPLVILFAACAFTSSAAAQAPSAPIPIGIVDFFGLDRLSPAQLRTALTFKEGDAVTFSARPPFQDESERRLKAIPGVDQASLNFVCCDEGRFIVYVGVEEAGAPRLSFRAPPTGSVRLAPEISAAGADFVAALTSAVQRGQAQEDGAQGHALAADPAVRAVQERFIVFARTGVPELRQVLRESCDPRHRALAAQVLAYADDKGTIIDDLVHAARDPDAEVRNNATRALWVLAQAPPLPGRAALQVPYEPFVDLLHSPVWSDRNKASLALLALTTGRDPGLLALLRARSRTPLAEMARWKSRGHAEAGFIVLARIAGIADEAARSAFERDDREGIIAAALR